MRNWRENLRDLLQLFLVPALAACLPWTLGFRLLRGVAHAGWTFPTETEAALAGARLLAPPADEQAWRTAHRLTRLVDHTDLYLSLLRSDRWLTKHAEVTGQWPPAAPFLAAFFHWGTGLWALRHLSRTGHSAAFLSIYFDRRTFRHAPLRYWYARLRAWETGRAAACPLIYTGNAPAEMRRLYRDGRSVTAAVDVPLAQTRGKIETVLFGRPAGLPKGVIRLALLHRVPVVLFSMGFDPASGRRRLRISPPLEGIDESTLAIQFAGALEALVESNSAAWHMWAHAQDFFTAGAGTSETANESLNGDLA